MLTQLGSVHGSRGKIMLDVTGSKTDRSSAPLPVPRHDATSVSAGRDRPTPPEISFDAIRAQVRRDVLAKEVQTSPTYSYQWMADQAGHIAVGLLIVLITWWIGRSHLLDSLRIDSVLGKIGISMPELSAWIGFLVAVIAISAVELYDYVQARRKLEPLFDATCDRKDLRDNVNAAIWYVTLGALIALAAILSWSMWLIPLFIASIVGPAIYWLRQKIRFQQIGLPFLFRLPEFKLDGFSKEVAGKIDAFIRTSGDAAPKHIAIVGELGTGKTNLAVGIATEGAFNGKKGRYLTLNKLGQIAHLTKEPPPPRNLLFWLWRESQILVIDDAASGLRNSSVDRPAQLLGQLQDDLGEALESIRARYTVWCLGADASTSDQWIRALKDGSGIADHSLLVVTLESDPSRPGRVRGAIHPLSKHAW
jgi:hypothetical protein